MTALFLIFLFFSGINAQVPDTANALCEKVAKDSILKEEAKSSKTKVNKISLSNFKLIGNGSMLYLYSGFVDGPNTGENTHWEVVVSFDAKQGICTTATSRRYWAH